MVKPDYALPRWTRTTRSCSRTSPSRATSARSSSWALAWRRTIGWWRARRTAQSMATRCVLPARIRSLQAEAAMVARSKVRFALAVAVALAAGACSFAPPLKIPAVPIADNYKESAPWTAAQPSDDLPRDAWWTLYGDEELNTLQKRLVENSPDLAAAL